MLITPEYREQNRLLHEQKSKFGAGQDERIIKQYGLFAKMTEELGVTDVLDYGCGKGGLAKAFPFPIKEYDPAIPGKDGTPQPADMVFCRDVLEHIEPGCINDVLGDLARCVKRFGLFTIAHDPSTDILPDGRNAHVLQRPPKWWLRRLRRYFRVIRFQPMLKEVVEKTSGRRIWCGGRIEDYTEEKTKWKQFSLVYVVPRERKAWLEWFFTRKDKN